MRPDATEDLAQVFGLAQAEREHVFAAARSTSLPLTQASAIPV
jgi:hypothetical protein